MAKMNSPNLPVSVYFVWQWWEKHFQQHHGRSDTIDFDWLDNTYLARQRFLHEHFSAFDIGSESPELDKNILAQVMPYNTVLIPTLLGMSPRLKSIGGYANNPLSTEQLQALKPVDLASAPLGELIRNQHDRMVRRYGLATQMIDLAGAANNAFMLRGTEFYSDLMLEKDLTNHYLGVITDTMILAYRFIRDLFGPIKSQWSGHEGVSLANCNVTMMSPNLYTEMVRPHDIRNIESVSHFIQSPPYCALHHCNVKAEPFAKTYSQIPGLKMLQASYLSDIPAIKTTLPDVEFSAMVNPVHITNHTDQQLQKDLDRCIADGAHDLAVWDIDSECDPSQIARLFDLIVDTARRHGRNAVFSVIPFSWEELAWEFPQYQQDSN